VFVSLASRGKDMRRTLLDNIRATFFFHVSLVGEPLDTFAERVHV
jgi:hypothetical protein